METAPTGDRILRTLGGDAADCYVSEFVLNSFARALRVQPRVSAILEELHDPRQSLCAIFACVAFNRRGRERFDISAAACDALAAIVAEEPRFLLLESAETLWNRYCALIRARGRKPQEQLERGPIQGLAELAQELARTGHLSICDWICQTIRGTGSLEDVVDRVLEIRGVGPKVCALMLRDLVFLSGLEDRVDYAERLYLQPVDKWMRIAAPFVIENLNEDEADWVLAGKVAKRARLAGTSGIRFNMGVTYAGVRSGSQDSFERQLKRLGGLPESLHRDAEAVEGEGRLESFNRLAETVKHGA
jgi:hypothetical protein